MDTHSQINIAIEQFSNWSKPWDFYQEVSSNNLLRAESKKLLDHIWATLTESSVWTSCRDQEQACGIIESNLVSNFPWISENARQQLIKGVSYQWK